MIDTVVVGSTGPQPSIALGSLIIAALALFVGPWISLRIAKKQIAASAALAVAGPFALRFAFPQYASAAPLILPFAVWGLFAGLYQPYNMFLASHGRGVEIRNIGLVRRRGSVRPTARRNGGDRNRCNETEG